MTKTATRIGLWAAGAIAVTALAAVAVTASAGAGPDVLTGDDVANALSAGPTGSATADPTAAASPGATHPTPVGGTAINTTGGSVVASCVDDLVRLVAWAPGPGYRADHVERGPATRAQLEFESDTTADTTVLIVCVNGEPSVKDLVDSDDHGGSGKGGGATHSADANSGRDHAEDD